MESTIVIKVKYGETLRRFTSRVYENELDLDMDGLRDKVHSLFHIAPDADLTLTYVDEDGDVITLVDEEDLDDVVRQSLNPLRITVKMNTEKCGRSYARSNGSSTPMRSSEFQHPLPNLSTGIAEMLKSVPEPFCEAFSKVSLDLASKAADSAPGLIELIESFSKIGLPHINSVFESNTAAEPSTHTVASGSTVNASIGKDPEAASKDDGVTSEVLPNMKFEEPISKNDQDVDLVNVAIGVRTSVAPLARKVLGGDNSEEMKKSGNCGVGGKSADVDVSSSSADSMRLCNLDPKTTDFGGDISTHSPIDYEKSSVSHVGLSPFSECPFSGMPLANDQNATHVQFAPRMNTIKRSYNPSDLMGSVFHRGVGCDGCGVHPITGPRFKSKVKEDYDLCGICFAGMGNEADYIRMDRPVSHPNPWSFKGFYDTMQQTPLGPPAMPHFLRSSGMKSKGPNLDSRFLWDVNVPDDTVMSPSTPFTKIWRMRNNGSVVWPQGTQLVWIGGDKLSDTLLVQISGDETPVGNELDIAVDFTAPELPGRYVSYWRMASPSGEKFGQTVFVIIQVDTALRDSSCSIPHYLNLNLPPHSDRNGITGSEIMNASVEHMVNDSLLEAENNSSKATESVKTIVEELKSKDLDLNFPIDNNLLVGGGVTIPVPSIASPAGSSPIIDLSEAAPFHAPYPIANELALVSVPLPGVGESNDVEQTLLRELEEMGFKQVYLNKEILRMNEYNLEKSVDDLAEWYPVLEELQEMGFCDEEVNERLLKNNGSVKRFVMDLIAGK